MQFDLMKDKLNRFKVRGKIRWLMRYCSILNILGVNTAPGTALWLMRTEFRYAQGKLRAERRYKSIHHTRVQGNVIYRTQGPVGGDRMIHHGYAQVYASYLRQFVEDRFASLTVVEAGILYGTGLAIWCDLFPSSRCIGLDLSLSFFHEYKNQVRRRGGFPNGLPEVYEFDQFADNRKMLADILGEKSIDIFIDDGCHADEAILNTFDCVKPYLSEEFVYFVEDNPTVDRKFRLNYPDLTIHLQGEIAVLTPARKAANRDSGPQRTVIDAA